MTKPWVFMSHRIGHDGYGYAGMCISKALGQEGIAAESIDLLVNAGHSAEAEHTWYVNGPGMAMCVADWYPEIHAQPLVGHTMFESTKQPEYRISMLNGCEVACVVPCEWCAEMFEAQGVRVPIHVVKWGMDPDDYYPLDRSDRRNGPYVFLWHGTPDRRKGWDVAYRAFFKAFGKNQTQYRSGDVQLIMHFRELPGGLAGAADQNVTVYSGYYSREGMRQMMRAADAFVYPARGEGWGLPPREAAATGLPVLATRWGGLAEEINEWAYPIEVAGTSPAEYGAWQAGDVGEWAEPSLSHTVELMRWLFDHREEAAATALRRSEWLRTQTTWRRTARGLAEVMRKVQGC